MPAPRSAPHARSLVLAAVRALLALPAATAQAWPGLNGYMAYGSTRTGSQFSDDIYVSPLDVESPIRLTFRAADDGQPAWSPDGGRLAFKTAQFGSNQLAVINADGTGETLLTRTFFVSEGQPAWSPDATRLLYRRTPQNPLVQNADTWVLDIAASAKDPAQPVTQPVLLRTGDERYPSYSPDGTQIAFRGDLDLVEPSGDEELYVMNADGSDQRRLTLLPRRSGGVSWSPEGEKIAFVAPAGHLGAADIFVMNADGSGLRNVTNTVTTSFDFAWSPDGRRIAYLEGNPSQAGGPLSVVNSDGTGKHRRMHTVIVDLGLPSWSTDGRTIAFTGGSVLYTVHADGTGLRKLTHGPGLNVGPRWSPDGRRILFLSFRDGPGTDLFVMNADGSGQRNLTHSPGVSELAASWAPS
jgi:TolB protein